MVKKASELDPIFIVGLPRSGTTLMSSILSGCADVSITPEIWYYNYWVPKYSMLDLSIQKDRDLFLENFLGSKRFSFLDLSGDEIEAQVKRRKELVDFDEIFRIVLEEYRIKEGSEKVGEKTPGQYRNIAHLLNIYPDCRIICMVRNPKSIISSLHRAPFGSKFDSFTARRWNAYVKSLEKYQNDDRVRIIRYEDLVSKTDSVILDLQELLEISIDSEQLHKQRKSSYTVSNREGWSIEHFTKAMSPINRNSLHIWKKELSPFKIQVIDFLTAENAVAWNYEVDKTRYWSGVIWLFVFWDNLRRRIHNLIRNPLFFTKTKTFRRVYYKYAGKIRERN